MRISDCSSDVCSSDLYVLENSDIAGFSRQEQQYLGALVRTHRRKIPGNAFDALPDRLLASARRSAALLRIAVLLHRGYDAREIPRLDAAAEGRSRSEEHTSELQSLMRISYAVF